MTRWAPLLLLLGSAAGAGGVTLKELLDPAHIPLQRYTKADWETLGAEEKRRAKGADPSEWVDPPPEVLRGTGGGDEKPDESPGFRFADRLKAKQAAFDALVGNPPPSTLKGLIRQLKHMDKASDRFAKEVQEELEKYNRTREAFAQALNNQIQNFLKRTGRYPDGSELTLPAALQRDYAQLSRSVERLLSVQLSEREFQEWVLVRVAGFVREYAEAERGPPLAALAAGLKDRDWRQRARCGEILARAGVAEATALLLDAVEAEKDPLVLGQLIRFAGWRGGERFEEVLRRRVEDPHWPVRAAVIRELAGLRRKESVDLLIEILAKEDGRLKDDAHRSLVQLTGRHIGPDAELWRGWWKAARGSWTPPEAQGPAEEGAPGDQRDGVVYFYGIQTHSKHIVFCIDISGSMLFRLDGGRDGGGTKEPRIDTARRELIKAIESLPADATFNLVVYNASVQVWKDGLVKATKGSRTSARLFVERLEPVGGTNIFDALAISLEIASRPLKGRGPEGDTIFFLTDGMPSVGQITDPDQILEEITARNRLYGVTIHCIGVAKEQNAEFLYNLARRNGGTYVGHK